MLGVFRRMRAAAISRASWSRFACFLTVASLPAWNLADLVKSKYLLKTASEERQHVHSLLHLTLQTVGGGREPDQLSK